MQTRQLQALAAGVRGAAHHAWPMGPGPATVGRGASGGEGGQRQGNIACQPFHQTVLGDAQRVEVGVSQALRAAGGHHGVDVDLIFRRATLCQRRRSGGKGFAHPRAALARLGAPFGAGQQLGEQLARDLRVAEEGVEQFAENGTVLFAADQHRLEGRAKIIAAR